MQDNATAFRLNIWHFDRLTIGEGAAHRWDYRGVSYPHWRIYWNREPGAWITVNGADHPLAPESVIVISPNTPIDSHVTGSVEHTFIHAVLGYPYDRVRPRIDHVPISELPMNQLERALSGPSAVPDRAQHLDIRQTLAVHGFLCCVLSSLPEQTWLEPPSHPAIRSLADEISRHPERPYRTAAMAKRCRMSVTTFLLRFKEQMQKTPQQFVTECRLQKACALLSGTTLSIEQIADACGYCDRFHLTKVFKAHYRCGPAAFRLHPTRLPYWLK